MFLAFVGATVFAIVRDRGRGGGRGGASGTPMYLGEPVERPQLAVARAGFFGGGGVPKGEAGAGADLLCLRQHGNFVAGYAELFFAIVSMESRVINTVEYVYVRGLRRG